MIPQALPKSKLGEAVRYALNQRSWLMNFLLDGRLEISNNRAERTIRPFTVGRKNWLFSYCKRGAEASAVVYSIVETAQANGLVPFMYLNYLFETLPNISEERFAECLPWQPTVQNTCIARCKNLITLFSYCTADFGGFFLFQRSSLFDGYSSAIPGVR